MEFQALVFRLLVASYIYKQVQIKRKFMTLNRNIIMSVSCNHTSMYTKNII